MWAGLVTVQSKELSRAPEWTFGANYLQTHTYSITYLYVYICVCMCMYVCMVEPIKCVCVYMHACMYTMLCVSPLYDVATRLWNIPYNGKCWQGHEVCSLAVFRQFPNLIPCLFLAITLATNLHLCCWLCIIYNIGVGGIPVSVGGISILHWYHSGIIIFVCLSYPKLDTNYTVKKSYYVPYGLRKRPVYERCRLFLHPS